MIICIISNSCFKITPLKVSQVNRQYILHQPSDHTIQWVHSLDKGSPPEIWNRQLHSIRYLNKLFDLENNLLYEVQKNLFLFNFFLIFWVLCHPSHMAVIFHSSSSPMWNVMNYNHHDKNLRLLVSNLCINFCYIQKMPTD